MKKGQDPDGGLSGLQGIVGGTYDRYLEGENAVSKPEDQLYIPEDVSPLYPVPVLVITPCCKSGGHASPWTCVLRGAARGG